MADENLKQAREQLDNCRDELETTLEALEAKYGSVVVLRAVSLRWSITEFRQADTDWTRIYDPDFIEPALDDEETDSGC